MDEGYMSTPNTHLERLTRFPFLPNLLYLSLAHLILVLTFSNATIVFKGKQNIQSRKFLQLEITFPLVGLEDEAVGCSPSRYHVDIELFEKSDDL